MSHFPEFGSMGVNLGSRKKNKRKLFITKHNRVIFLLMESKWK